MNVGTSGPAVQTLKTAKLHFLSILILLVLAVGTYHGLPSHSFLDSWDDPGYVTGNQAIRGFSHENMKAAFTQHFVGNYSPVQIISYMLDYVVWGLTPAGFLVSNIAIHFLNGVLLYTLLIRNGIWMWGAVLGSALFLVHPVQMESVAWISQRKNLLALLFSLLGFHAYLNYCKAAGKMGWKWYAYSFSAFILALLSKPVAVVFPLMLIVHDRLMSVRCRSSLRWHVDKVPYLVAACAVATITIMIQEPGVVGGRIEYPAMPWLVLPLTMLPVLVSYLHLLIWPAPSNLSIIYTTPFRHSLDATVLSALCIAALLLALGVYLYRRNRHVCFWYALFFLGFLPVSQVVPLVTLMNDRYLYFPMLGLAGLTGHLFSLCRERIHLPMLRFLCFVSAVAVIAVLSFASHVRGRVWQNSITLFSDAVIKAPNQLNPLLGLAEGYRAAGNNEMALKYYEEASKYGYLSADVSHSLARIYLDRGELEKAHSHIWGFLLKSSDPKEGLLLLDEYKLLLDHSQTATRR